MKPIIETRFDPFTATLEAALAQPDAHDEHGAVLRWGAAQGILRDRTDLEKYPIDGIARCVRAGLLAPEWLAAAFLRQYGKVLRCEVPTWDDAFGPAKPAGVHLSTLRLRRKYGHQIYALFDAPWGAHLPRTDAGRREAAQRLGLTEKQVRTLLPKTRINVRGHKPYSYRASHLASANDPFSLALKKPKR